MIKWLDEHLEESILAFLMATTSIIVFLQVIMRFVFSNSLTWSEELARYLFIWLIFIGVSYGIKKGLHLTVDALDVLFEARGRVFIDILANICIGIFLCIMTYHGSSIVINAKRLSAALEIPMKLVYLAPVVGFGLSIIRLIQNTAYKIKVLREIKDSEEGGVR